MQNNRVVKVISAISLAINIDPKKVINIRIKNRLRKLPEVNNTNRRAIIVKNLILRSTYDSKSNKKGTTAF